MKARELLAKLNNLVLFGYEDGQLIWCGTDKQWKTANRESHAPGTVFIGYDASDDV